MLSRVDGKGYFFLFHTVCTTDKRAQLKQEYDVVKEMRGLSGFGWDPQLCTVSAGDDDVWIAYIKVSSCLMWHSLCTHAYTLTESDSQQTENGQSISHEALPIIQRYWGSH